MVPLLWLSCDGSLLTLVLILLQLDNFNVFKTSHLHYYITQVLSNNFLFLFILCKEDILKQPKKNYLPYITETTFKFANQYIYYVLGENSSLIY